LGRTKAIIGPQQFEECAKIGMTQVEVANLFGVDQSRISRLLQKTENREAWNSGKADLCVRLRTAQIEAAVDKHDRTMLIWLGKAMLGQVDAPRNDRLEIDQRVSVRYIAAWGRDNAEIQAASNPMMIDAADDDWEEEEGEG